MNITESSSLKKFRPRKSKQNKRTHLNWVIQAVENGTGYSVNELKSIYSEEKLFLIALKHVSTTKKSLCKALGLGVDNCCRYKRDLEKKGLLVESIESVTCFYTGCDAKVLSTNPEKFNKLRKSNQLKLIFKNEQSN